MNRYVLDASALLALLNSEKGAEFVEERLDKCIMSDVNLSEVAARLVKNNIPIRKVREMITFLIDKTIPFDDEQAFTAADLILNTKKYGLSFGDRACLSLGKHTKLPILTADKIWEKLDLNLKIILIR